MRNEDSNANVYSFGFINISTVFCANFGAKLYFGKVLQTTNKYFCRIQNNGNICFHHGKYSFEV